MKYFSHLACSLLDVSELKQASDGQTQEQADQRHGQAELAHAPERQLVPTGGGGGGGVASSCWNAAAVLLYCGGVAAATALVSNTATRGAPR